MALPVGQTLDMKQLEILNLRLQVLATAPASPVAGQIWYDSAGGSIIFRGASANIDLRARANHTGTQPIATLSDLNTARLSFFSAPNAAVAWGGQKITGLANGTAGDDAAAFGQIAAAIAVLRLNTISASADVNLGGFKATNLAAGTLSTDAATYGQLQAAINALDWKPSVRALHAANVAALSGTGTYGGVALVAGDRVLLTGQTTPAQNGIWVVQTGAWTRPADYTGATTASGGTSVYVEEGTNADQQWRLITDGVVTVDTTATTWTQIGGTTTYVGDGTTISITGNTIAAVTGATNYALVRKWSATVGDGATTAFSCAHGFGHKDVQVVIREVATGDQWWVENRATDNNNVLVTFAVAPTAGQFRVTIQG
jgi:Coiled stalk of trimeric autotransporter adhesin